MKGKAHRNTWGCWTTFHEKLTPRGSKTHQKSTPEVKDLLAGRHQAIIIQCKIRKIAEAAPVCIFRSIYHHRPTYDTSRVKLRHCNDDRYSGVHKTKPVHRGRLGYVYATAWCVTSIAADRNLTVPGVAGVSAQPANARLNDWP